MKISVITSGYGPNKYRIENYTNLVKCLRRQSYDDFEIILVEQMQKKARYDDLCFFWPFDIVDKYRKIYTFPEDFRRGWCSNVGAKSAEGEILCFLDADLYFRKDFLQKVVEFFICKAHALGWSKIAYLDRKERTRLIETGEIREDNYHFREKPPIRHGGTQGGAVLFQKEFFFSSLYGYNENFTRWGACDSEIMWRATELTEDWYAMNYTIYHLWHPRTQSVSPQNLGIYDSTMHAPFLVNSRLGKVELGQTSGPTCIDTKVAN